MDEQELLMTKLLDLYKKRYSDKELEKKFNDACIDLISTGDIKRGVYMKFCIENDVEPIVPKTKSSGYPQMPAVDSCGGGGRSVSRGC